MPAIMRMSADAWRLGAASLAQWSEQRLINAVDHWLNYLPLRRQSPQCRATPGRGPLTARLLERHFAGHDAAHRLAVASTDAQGLTRWLAIEVECEPRAQTLDGPIPDGPTGEREVTPGVNFHAILGWDEKLRSLQFDPIVEDLDGAGGYRLLLLFDEPESAERVAAFGQQLVVDYADRELLRPPRLLPAPTLEVQPDAGTYLRLPGPHPWRDHASRIWDGDRWLEGAEAVAALLTARATSPQFIRKPRPTVKKRIHLPPRQAPPLQSPPAKESVMPATPAAQPSAPMTSTAPATPPAVATPVTPATPGAGDPVAMAVAAIAERTGLRESEVTKRLLAWFEQQDEVIQAVVLGQVPEAIRPNIVQLLLERMAAS